MDPKACLDRAYEALRDGDGYEAFQALQDYWAWRRRGGFEPSGGDTRARDLNASVFPTCFG